MPLRDHFLFLCVVLAILPVASHSELVSFLLVKVHAKSNLHCFLLE